METQQTPTFAELAADPDIAALLNFDPVHRQMQKANGWTPAMQRMFIAWLAYYGSPGNAAAELGKARSGIDKVYKAPDADSFRAAWNGAVALAEQRRIDRLTGAPTGAGAMTAPTLTRISRTPPGRDDPQPLLPGQVYNEYGEPEDEAYYRQRGEDAMPSIRTKLLAIRRLFLRDISGCPGKRAAFEILTELPIDWEAAKTLGAQADEPWHNANQREPDMILTAETGWSFGHEGYGPDRTAQARRHIDEYLTEQGLPPVRWDGESTERSPADA